MAVQPTSLRCRRAPSPQKAKATPAPRDRAVMNKPPSPAPPKKQPGDSFRFFSNLPPELRLKIWNLSLPSPRLVSIQCGSSSLDSQISTSPSQSPSPSSSSSSRSSTNGCISSAPIPTSLHICADSRREALKTYRPSFGFARGPGHVFFSPAADTLYFGPRVGFMAAGSQFHTCMALCDPAELACVRRLAISDALFWIGSGGSNNKAASAYRFMTAISLTAEVLRQIAARMPGLQELVFVPREHHDDEDDDEDDDAAVRERMNRQIQTAMHSVCQQFPAWRPPPWAIVPLSALPSPAG